jgi:hypothetical protein
MRRVSQHVAVALVIGLLAVVAIPQVALGAVFAARASITPYRHYVADSGGTLFTVKVRNTGTVRSLGAVQFNRPTSFWQVLDCPAGPSGWTAIEATFACRYVSAPGTADDIMPGHSATFDVLAATSAANSNRTGIWSVWVSTTDFSDPAWIKQAMSKSPGLKVRAFSFEVLDAVVADSPATPGDPCPAANKNADSGSTVVIVICGSNHTNIAQTPVQKYSWLGGTFMTSHGAFTSGPIPAGATNVVLGNWSDVAVALGSASNLTVTGRIGGKWSTRTSPKFKFTSYVLNEVPVAPVALDDNYTIDEDSGSFNVSAPGVLDNDSDANLDSLLAVIENFPGHSASFGFNDDGSFIYFPHANFNGQDTFTYHATDGSLNSNVATVTITVNPVNDPPTAVDDTMTVTQDTTATVPAPGLLDDATDIDSASLTAVLVSGPSHAQSFTLNGDGSVSYQPSPGYTGTDSFTWKANDGSLDSNTATVTSTVSSVGGGGGGGGGGCLIVC